MKWTQYFSNFNIHFKMNHFIYQVNFDNFAKFLFLLLAGEFYLHIIGDLDELILPLLRHPRPLPAKIC